MYGYSVSGAESEGSAFANLTGNPVPAKFSASIIPSLLFGSLISATDPGKYGVESLPLNCASPLLECSGHYLENRWLSPLKSSPAIP